MFSPRVDGWPAEDWQAYPCDLRKKRCPPRLWKKQLGLDPGPGLWFLHRCGDLTCWQVYHIYVGTPSDNNRDRWAHNPELRIKQAEVAARTLNQGPRSAKHRASQSAAMRAYHQRKRNTNDAQNTSTDVHGGNL